MGQTPWQLRRIVISARWEGLTWTAMERPHSWCRSPYPRVEGKPHWPQWREQFPQWRELGSMCKEGAYLKARTCWASQGEVWVVSWRMERSEIAETGGASQIMKGSCRSYLRSLVERKGVQWSPVWFSWIQQIVSGEMINGSGLQRSWGDPGSL